AVQAQVRGTVRGHVVAAGVEQLDRAADVAVAEVEQRHGRLDQPLHEAPLRAGAFGPQVFPDLVRLEEVVPVEEQDAGQVARVVGRLGRPHAGIVRAAAGAVRYNGEAALGAGLPTPPTRATAGLLRCS